MPTHQGSTAPVRQPEEIAHGARIKVVGVGGGGSNAIDRMIDFGVEGVEFIALNTDIQALEVSKAQIRGQIGSRLTNGLSAGSDPDVGRRAAIEDAGQIAEALEGADMVFITAGLGGGTGTGAAPVIAAIASEMGALTVAIVTRPFGFEGKRRMAIADWGIHHLLNYVDTLIVIPNEKLLAIARDAPFFESFQIADDFLRQAVQGISDIITTAGVINRDFADVKTTMAGMGYAVMGTASRSGPDRAIEAVMAAMESPLLEAGAIDGARGILINITGSSSLRLSEVNDASSVIQSVAHEDANIIFGAVLDERVGDEVKVTVIASGFRQDGRDRSERRARMLRGTGLSAITSPPVAESPAIEQPIVKEPAIEEQLSERATVGQFVVEQPVVGQPVPEQAIEEQPVPDSPVVEAQPVVEELPTEDVIEAHMVEGQADALHTIGAQIDETIPEHHSIEDDSVDEPIFEAPVMTEAPETVVPPIFAPPGIEPPVPVELPVIEMELPAEDPQEVELEETAASEEPVPQVAQDRQIVRYEPEEEVHVEGASSFSFADAYETDEPQEEFHGDEDWKDVIRELARLTEPDMEFDGLSDDGPDDIAAALRSPQPEAPIRYASKPLDEPAPRPAFSPLAIPDHGTSRAPQRPVPPPPISNVRQAAIAAYAAVSTPDTEPEPQRPKPSNAFAEVLEARRRFVESMNRATAAPQQQESPAPIATNPKPQPELLAEVPTSNAIEDIPHKAQIDIPQQVEAFDFEEADEGASVHLSEQAALAPVVAEAPAPRVPIHEFFDSPLFRDATAYSGSSSEIEAVDDLPKPLPDFKRRLAREAGTEDRSQLSEGAPEPEARVPSFATVPDHEAYTDEFDELDIPAFLRRGR